DARGADRRQTADFVEGGGVLRWTRQRRIRRDGTDEQERRKEEDGRCRHQPTTASSFPVHVGSAPSPLTSDLLIARSLHTLDSANRVEGAYNETRTTFKCPGRRLVIVTR